MKDKKQEMIFSYDFEISKNGLTSAFNKISLAASINDKLPYGNATVYFVQMGLAALTFFEKTYKDVTFDFSKETVKYCENACSNLIYHKEHNNIKEEDFGVYMELISAYYGWCINKEYSTYFATIGKNSLAIIIGETAINLHTKILARLSCEDDSQNLNDFFNSLKNIK